MAFTFLTNEDELKYVRSVNGVTPDENGNVHVFVDYTPLVNVTHDNMTNFTCDRTYGDMQEIILEGMLVVGIFTNTASGVTEQLHAELHDEDGEIWFVSTHGTYIFYAAEVWEYDTNLALTTKEYVDEAINTALGVIENGTY
jgi:hypothetical protein